MKGNNSSISRASVSISQGRRDFCRLIREVLDKKQKIIITKRQESAAVLIPYDKHQRMQRLEGYKWIMEARGAFLKAGVKAKDVLKQSKMQLGG